MAIGWGIEAYIELNPEFSGILGVVGTGGLTLLVLPILALPSLPGFPLPLLLGVVPFPVALLTWSTDRRWVRSFSSRLHLALRFENHTWGKSERQNTIIAVVFKMNLMSARRFILCRTLMMDRLSGWNVSNYHLWVHQSNVESWTSCGIR